MSRVAPRGEGGGRVLVRRVGVTDRHGHPGRAEGLDRAKGTGALRVERDLAQRAVGGREQAVDDVGRRVDEMARVVCAAPVDGEERPLEVTAEYSAVGPGERGDGGELLFEHVDGGGDETRDAVSRAVRRVQVGGRADAVYAVFVAVPAAAVPVQVDEAGGQRGALTVDALCLDGGRSPGPRLGDALAIDEHPGIGPLTLGVYRRDRMEQPAPPGHRCHSGRFSKTKS
ncbi:hypothetical protein [Microbacterium trichothecenolyticum]|uniref:Uncharacterized protein n=1 Tax=Microbacterium trichothecenolyticum TaxID=69370 RepID=A0ABU0TY56_MICTR|nr:hypothetical protein [Microbacterium trichothecenolyticum]MDQ1124595.1 hypothetical protein [Microbacterium trichothecenolyticum]